MVIEPESKFRFRYVAESGGTSHGGIPGKGKTSDRKKTYPKVQLKNYYQNKKVYIRVSLFTANKEKKEKHVFEIKGKNARDGMCYEDLKEDFTATFANLGIISKKQDEVKRILMNKKIESMGHSEGTDDRAKLEKKYATEIQNKAKEIVKSVRLCFEAFTEDNPTEPICAPLFSGPIHNGKSSEKGPLRIYHISHCSGSCKGGDMVILLCDKVQKGKVKVHFYDKDGKWEADSESTELHYQVAIIFTTPEFKEMESMEKEVWVCLVRDDEKSNSVSFTYRADDSSPSKKWKRNSDLESRLLTCHEDTPASSSSNDSPDNFVDPVLAHNNLYDSHMSESECSNIDAPQFTDLKPLRPANFQDSPYNFMDPMLAHNNLYNSHIPESECGNIDTPQFTDLEPLSPANFQEASTNDIPDFDMDELPVNIDEIMSYIIGNTNNDIFTNEMETDGPTESRLNMSVATHQMLDGQMSLEKHMSNLTLEGKDETMSIPSCILKCMRQNRISSNLKDKLKTACLKWMSVRDESDSSFLHEAVRKNKDVRQILELYRLADCDIVNVKNCDNETAVHIAVEKNDYKTLSLLLKYGGNSNLKDRKGNTCLHVAAENGYVNCMKEIFSYRCDLDVNTFNYQGFTPLHISVMKGFSECVELLLKYSDVNAVDQRSGRSPLHFAVDMQPLLLPVLLRKHDTVVNIQDFGGNTPLHLASISAHADCVKQLLEARADPLLRNYKKDSQISDENSENEDDDGETAMDVAENSQIKELLWKAIEKTCSSVDSDFSDELDSVTEEKLCQLLDPEKYQSLAEMHMDKCLIGQLKLYPSPTKQILKYLKVNYEDKYIVVLKNALEAAELYEALKIIKERHY